MSSVILNWGLEGSASSAQVDWSSSACKQRQGFSFSTIYSVVTISCTTLSEKKRNTTTHVSGTTKIFLLLYEINIQVFVFTGVTVILAALKFWPARVTAIVDLIPPSTLNPNTKVAGWLIDSFLSGQVSPDLSLPSSCVAWLTSHSKRK